MAHDSREPMLAIVLPVFKHSVLVAEAIESGLEQETTFDYRIVIVNDGCPFAETDLVCSSYALARPDRVVYIKKPNGGLSSARNAGINHALRQWDSLQAVYFLDADNRLHPKALQHGYDALAARGFTGWVYPDIDMFGYPWHGDYAGGYCTLTHLGSNICEAGSMVSRQLLDKGVRFDENMKLGYEDWDFWLSALEAGESGTHCPEFGFQYRKRAESMLADSTRDSEEILSYVRRKHAPLFKQKFILQTEHAELPRYAIFLEDSRKIILVTDPREGGRELSMEDFDEAWWACAFAPSRHKLPSFVVVSSQRTLDLLDLNGLLHWTLWRLEDALSRGDVVALASIADAGQLSGAIGIGEGAPHYSANQRCADIAMIATRTLHSAVVDPCADWIHSLRSREPAMPVFDMEIRATVPQHYRQYRGAVAGLLNHYTGLRESGFSEAPQRRWLWKDPGTPPQFEGYRRAREACQLADALYPRIADAAQRDVAFLLPLLKFGGVEKVALNVAREMAAQGWRVTFVIMDERQACFNRKEYGFVDSIVFFDSATRADWSGRPYYGTLNDRRAECGDAGRLVGLLAGMDLVINSHSALASGAMAQLRRRGIKTANYLHVTDLTPHGRPVGHTYLGLAYEHAYDYFLTCSNSLAHWLHGMGVPASKVVAVPNGPGYPLAPQAQMALLGRRQFFTGDRKLRILFIGRFDGQKGLERALDLAAHLEEAGLPAEWRFVGASVIGQSGTHARHQALLARDALPPAYNPWEITEHYLWADLLFLPSHWEGLPLTVIEAMRVGCVPLSTGVGAIDEAVEHMETGLTLKDYRLADAARLVEDIATGRLALAPIAARAIAAASARTWRSIDAFPLAQAQA